MRWLVGDLQGCVEPFDRLLRAIDYDPSRDELWVLGDLVNRGPESAETLRLWRDIGGRAILGNHDVYALLTASGLWKRKQDTLDDLFTAKDYHELLALLRGLPVLVQLSDDVWIVHAGIHPAWDDLKKIRKRLDALPHLVHLGAEPGDLCQADLVNLIGRQLGRRERCRSRRRAGEHERAG